VGEGGALVSARSGSRSARERVLAMAELVIRSEREGIASGEGTISGVEKATSGVERAVSKKMSPLRRGE
jgi:hypothetical protein